jgi:heme exporter protein C
MQFLANPHRFFLITDRLLPALWIAAALAFIAGLYLAFFSSPPDYQQGETVRIMYVHVPSATLALGIYVLMALASAMAWIFKHPLADAAAKAAAPLGAAFCFLALFTGSLWGKPMWGTWWVWDARLTSMFVLMLLYLGYMAVWRAFDDQKRAAELARVVALVGVINIPIVKFSVNWWNTLHQPASIVRMGGPAIDKSILWPLAIMFLAFALLFIALHLMAMKNEARERKILAEKTRAIGQSA